MKNKFLIAAIVVVACASAAYAAFAQNLNVNGVGSATGNWAVQITAISLSSSAGAVNHNGVAPVVASDGLSASFNVNLAYPGATATYDMTIKNTGNIPAKLTTLTDLTAINGAAPNYITYTLSGISVNYTLAAGATATARVSVAWSASATTNPNGANKAATISLGYVQNT